MPKLWNKKPIAALQAEAAHDATQEPMTPCRVPLKRTLSAMSLIALGIGNIIGAGIFVLTGQAAAAHAGPAIGLSFVISAIACAFAGMCYAELASSVPISGSAYTYAYATMGEIVAWIIGWDLLLEYALGAATVAIGWSGYVVGFSGILASCYRTSGERRRLNLIRPAANGNERRLFSMPRPWW
jgi:APA family basic amino acid/polyamine antiporter